MSSEQPMYQKLISRCGFIVCVGNVGHLQETTDAFTRYSRKTGPWSMVGTRHLYVKHIDRSWQVFQLMSCFNWWRLWMLISLEEFLSIVNCIIYVLYKHSSNPSIPSDPGPIFVCCVCSKYSLESCDSLMLLRLASWKASCWQPLQCLLAADVTAAITVLRWEPVTTAAIADHSWWLLTKLSNALFR